MMQVQLEVNMVVQATMLLAAAAAAAVLLRHPAEARRL